jgi:hypothetical protein
LLAVSRTASARKRPQVIRPTRRAHNPKVRAPILSHNKKKTDTPFGVSVFFGKLHRFRYR